MLYNSYNKKRCLKMCKVNVNHHSDLSVSELDPGPAMRRKQANCLV